jgi:hypothetical protein
MRKYMVLSPEYQAISMSYDPPDPGEFGRDYIEVEADNPQDAKLFAVKLWRKERGRRYVKYYNDENPFNKLTVEEVPRRRRLRKV